MVDIVETMDTMPMEEHKTLNIYSRATANNEISQKTKNQWNFNEESAFLNEPYARDTRRISLLYLNKYCFILLKMFYTTLRFFITFDQKGEIFCEIYTF